MSEDKLQSLAELKRGESGIIETINGGQDLNHRLESMGLRLGKEITKVSSMFMHGPITVKVGQSQCALGHGMATKIMVRVKA